MITKTIHDAGDLRRAFEDMGRGDQYSWAAFRALFDWLQELSEGTGEDYRLDVVGECCTWCEYDTVQEACEAFSVDTLDDMPVTYIVTDTDTVMVADG